MVGTMEGCYVLHGGKKNVGRLSIIMKNVTLGTGSGILKSNQTRGR